MKVFFIFIDIKICRYLDICWIDCRYNSSKSEATAAFQNIVFVLYLNCDSGLPCMF